MMPIGDRVGVLGGVLALDVDWSDLRPECERSVSEMLFQVAAARHALADSELALSAYGAMKSADMSDGELYLATYGALHSISMRSAALSCINEVFRDAWAVRIVSRGKERKLQKAAEARHHVLAHPFEPRRKLWLTSFTGIYRQSLRIGGFALTKFELMSGEVSRERGHGGETVEHGSVDVDQIIQEQTNIILAALDKAIQVARDHSSAL